ncbi:transcriptional regulator, HxlR family [Chitinophaga jiangningensis]|uniref:Transcriptional regulator, HxlR family n=1 Tax=Chitinophaga jiangningensis TaxID=1419482 RepID=A0A1M7IPF1_9BACT|nr:helix-turn-helix domain-containing protein [Chitinophaga jiangningensis]SHM42600.1 transcriptional regulator, HxlR family [Chitinophaga jiangningensis]
MYTRKIEEDLDCGLILGMKVLGGKWKCCILDAIHKGFTRPSEITRSIREASPRVIEMQLAELLFFGVIEKNLESEQEYPKRTEYHLTPLGQTLLPILSQIDAWGLQHADIIKERLTEV